MGTPEQLCKANRPSPPRPEQIRNEYPCGEPSPFSQPSKPPAVRQSPCSLSGRCCGQDRSSLPGAQGFTFPLEAETGEYSWRPSKHITSPPPPSCLSSLCCPCPLTWRKPWGKAVRDPTRPLLPPAGERKEYYWGVWEMGPHPTQPLPLLSPTEGFLIWTTVTSSPKVPPEANLPVLQSIKRWSGLCSFVLKLVCT